MDTKTALITGAARRIGAETARTLHAGGYRVAVHYNNSQAEATTLVDTLNAKRPDSAIAIQEELTSDGFAERLLGSVMQAWGRLDLLVNNASIYEPSDQAPNGDEHWERMIATNLKSPYLLSTGAAPMLREHHGVIINLTDVYGLRPLAGHAVYCTSKAGLIGMTKALALDLAPHVRVNGISPGAIIWATGDHPGHRDEVLAKTPLARVGAPNDIARAVRYLAEAPYVTGQILEVDGGRSIYI